MIIGTVRDKYNVWMGRLNSRWDGGYQVNELDLVKLIEIPDMLQRLRLWWRMVYVLPCIPLRVHSLHIMHHVSYVLFPRY